MPEELDSSPKKHFLLIDAHALIYRAFHAFPALTTPKGQLVNAVYGFTRHILVAIRDYQPDYIAVCFDHKGKTFRHADFVEYKAQRAPMPDELKQQIPLTKQVVETLNIPLFSVEGYEADDLIGTLARQIEEHSETQNVMTVIVTGDRDAFQLVDDNTHVWLPGRGKGQEDTEYNSAAVKTRMGVLPSQIIDLKALMGDASDNIPGVTGVGEKTATKLITEFETLEKVYAAVKMVTEGTMPDASSALAKKSLLDKLVTGKDSAFLSQKLATIDRYTPVQLEPENCRVYKYDKEAAQKLFEELGFKSLLKLLPADEFELDIQGALF